MFNQSSIVFEWRSNCATSSRVANSVDRTGSQLIEITKFNYACWIRELRRLGTRLCKCDYWIDAHYDVIMMLIVSLVFNL